MNKPTYKSYDELPLTLSALNIGSRILIPKYKFLAWIDGSSSKKG